MYRGEARVEPTAKLSPGYPLFIAALRMVGGDTSTVLAANIALSLASLRSEEHTSELQSLMRISYAVFCLKKKKKNKIHKNNNNTITKQNQKDKTYKNKN